MTRSSSLARLLQAITLTLLAAAGSWFAWWWQRSPWLAMAGFAAIAVCYAGALGVEFIALARVNRGDPAPQAGVRALLRAWMAEILQAPRVFGWRQPFRWNAVPDRLAVAHTQGQRRGIVLVHGFFCNRGFWTPWLHQLEAGGHPFVAVNLEPVFASIDHYTQAIEKAVAAVTQASGLPPLLVCHSMGGLAARAWLRAAANAARVHHVVTIASPHQGTWLARFSRQANGRQMAIDSAWLRQLQADEADMPQPPFTCWYSNCDNVIFPSSHATLPLAHNLLVPGIAHVELSVHPAVMAGTLALLDGR